MELEKPLSVTIHDIAKDLRNFVNGFPIERIPHATEADVYFKREKTKFIKAILAGEDAALDRDPDDPTPTNSLKSRFGISPEV